jgi:trigger factor
MRTELTNVDQIVRHLSVYIDTETYERDFNKAMKKFSRQIEIPGFRKGKAPENVIKKRYADQVFSFYVDEFANEYYQTGLMDANANPMSVGSSIDVKFSDDGEIIFVYEFEALPTGFTYEYKDLEVKYKPTELSEETIDETIQTILNDNAEEIPFDEKTKLKKGDKVKVLDTITSTELAPFILDDTGIEVLPNVPIKKIIGLKLNDTFISDVVDDSTTDTPPSLPTKYQIIDAFKIKKPELNDETAKVLGHEDVIAFRESVRQNLQKNIDEKNKNELNHAIMFAFGQHNIENLTIPKEYLLSVGKRSLRQYLSGQMDEQQLKSLPEDIFMNFAEQQKPYIIWDLAFDTIATDHDITVSDEEFDTELVRYANDFNIEIEDFKTRFAHNLDSVKENLLANKVLEFIKPFCKYLEPEIDIPTVVEPTE